MVKIKHKKFSKGKTRGIIFLERSRLQYYQEDKNTIYKLNFTSDSINNLEIISRDILSENLKKFITDNSLEPADIFIVLAESVLFEKKLALPLTDNQTEIEKQFLENIPLEHITLRRYNNEKEIILTAVNKDLYQVVQSIFHDLGFSSKGIIPEHILLTITKKTDFDQTLAKLILTKLAFLRQIRYLLIQPEQGAITQLLAQEKEKSRKSPILPIIIPFFFILIGLLIFIIIYQSQLPPPALPDDLTPTVRYTRIKPEDTSTPSILPATPSAIIQKEFLNN